MARRNLQAAEAYAVPSKTREELNSHLALQYKDYKEGTFKQAAARVQKRLIDRNWALESSLPPSAPNELTSLVCADISTSAGYLRYRQQLVRHHLANKFGTGLISDYRPSHLPEGGLDIAPTNPRTKSSAIADRNTTSGFLQIQIPAELILNVAEMIEDDADLLSFRAACHSHMDLVDGSLSLRDRLANRVQDSCDEFLQRVHMDCFLKQAIQESQGLAQGAAPRGLLCSFCWDRHPASDFDTTAYAKGALQRVCKAFTAAMYVCPHRSLSFQEILMLRRKLAIRSAVNRTISERLSLCLEPDCGRYLVIGQSRTYRGQASKEEVTLVRTTELKTGDADRGGLNNPKVPTDDMFDHTVALDINNVPSKHNPEEERNQTKEAEWAREALVRADAYICPHLRSSSAFVYTVIQERINLDLYGRNFGCLETLPSAALQCPESSCGTKVELYCQRDFTLGAIEKQFRLRLIIHEKAFSLRLMTDNDWLQKTNVSRKVGATTDLALHPDGVT